MNSFINSVNGILTQWKKEHDIFDAVSLNFSESNGFLCFRDLPLCKLEDNLEMVGAEASTEGIGIYLNDKRSILISFIWPEDEPPKVELVSIIYRFYVEEFTVSSGSDM